MENLYNEDDSKTFIKKYSSWPEELAARVHTSRLLGSESTLVLHGGGNTSVKLRQQGITGENTSVIYIKGSGADLSNIEPDGFSAMKLDPLKKLSILEQLSDKEMDNQLKINMADASSPLPSVEALVHAFLPHKYIDHTHSDSILILTNQKNGEDMIKEALGDKIAVLPYFMSGFPLAKGIFDLYESKPEMEAIIVLNHGIFTFGGDARKAYDRMITYVTKAEDYIKERVKNSPLTISEGIVSIPENTETDAARCAQIIRGACSHKEKYGRPRRFYAEIRNTPDMLDLSLADNASAFCKSGVLTPDHAVRTKNHIAYIGSVPKNDDDLTAVINKEIDSFKNNYQKYFLNHSAAKEGRVEMLDSYPRLFLIAGIGLIALGFTRKQAQAAADIGERTILAKLAAEPLGGYEPIADSHIFDMEYWARQLVKVTRSFTAPLQGQVAVITGAGGAVGFGVADRLLAAGAVVVVSDIDEKRLTKVYDILRARHDRSCIEKHAFDVTDYDQVAKAFENISLMAGGIDLVVPNAGIAHVATIEELDPDKLDSLLAVNLKGTFTVIKAAVPVFRRQGTGGNIVFISSKNVFDPGAAFGAYSASKAGAHQLAKIAALEMAELGVRVNMVNPDAVFGDEDVSSGLWDLVGPDRMKSRGLDAEGLKKYYRQRNLLKKRVKGEHVGNAVVFFASELTPTTGAALPVDGGNPATFSR